jgi:serine/threonine-protein kinase
VFASPIHPGSERLASYGLGRLNDAEADSIRAHLEVCAPCRAAVERLSHDGLALVVRRAAGPPAPPAADPDTVDVASGGETVGAPGPPPARAGRCELLGEVGRGGMGEVLAGRDPALNRPLAVKVLREDHRGNAELERRFLEEAQVCGQLQHPGVPPVYDLGRLDDGRPFFTMKLVRGRTLAEVLRERQAPADGLPRFVAVFEQVCQTLAYAHSRGVIHRDLKPSNVMVGEFGEVQVMDWGLAKVLASRDHQPRETPPGADSPGVVCTVQSEAADRSQAGVVLGTLVYMAPEQARAETGRLDARADVFGLGAVLCEILTGAPPYRGGRLGVLTQAASADLADAFTRLDGCGADAELVRLARACLAPDVAARPADAAAVARAVTAYRRSVEERLRAAELARVEERARAARARQRLWWGLALAASGLLTAAVLAVGGWLWQRRQAEADRQAAATTTAVEADLDAATEAARAGEDGRAREALERAEGRLAGGGFDDLRRRVEALRGELDFAARLEEIRLEEAELREGGIDWKAADAAYAEAFRKHGLDPKRLAAAEAGDRIGASPARERIAAALDDWVVAKRAANAEGLAWVLEAVRRADRDARRALLRDEAVLGDAGRLKALAARTDVADWPPASAVVLATALRGAGEPAAAAMLREVQRRHPGDFWVNEELALCLYASRPSQPGEAAGFARAATAARPGTAWAHLNLGVLLKEQNKPAEAEAEFREAIRLQPDFPAAHNNLGLLLDDQGKAAEAEAEYREALRIKPDDPDAHYNLGNLQKKQDKPAEAEKEYREALRIKPDDPEAHTNLGNLLARQNQPAEAEKEYREAIRLKPDYALAHNNLGALLAGQGKAAEAEREYREALRIKPDDPDAHVNLGHVLVDQHKPAEAEKEYREALRIKPDYHEARCNLGFALQGQGRFREALDELRRGHELGSRDLRWPHPSADWVKDCERLAEQDALLPAVLGGAADPADADADLGFARVCYYTKRYVTAARFSAEAFAAAPAQAEDVYGAACSAALAGCGRGADAPAAEAYRARLRAQALVWLRADLAWWAKMAESGNSKALEAVRGALHHWQEDAELAGIRDAAELAMLPEAEQAEWKKLWADVDALLKRAAPGE